MENPSSQKQEIWRELRGTKSSQFDKNAHLTRLWDAKLDVLREKRNFYLGQMFEYLRISWMITFTFQFFNGKYNLRVIIKSRNNRNYNVFTPWPHIE